MKAEIIAVGTELLLGQVVNTNATFLSEQLADLGIEVYYQTVVGDNQQRLEELIALAKPLNCHINLIPVNPIKERDFVQPDMKYVQNFKNKLEKNRVNATIRREMGRDIDGACGQLRRKHVEKKL